MSRVFNLASLPQRLSALVAYYSAAITLQPKDSSPSATLVSAGVNMLKYQQQIYKTHCKPNHLPTASMQTYIIFHFLRHTHTH